MPAKSRSEKFIKNKIKKLLKEGRGKGQSIAIALDMARRKKK